ncbi:uncharacterized protein LOC143920164 [Arctopsyche grandis]|uniref:uncharacterized protein LOC143920164 n=1 Tax=Arctopsyche grandis TaxID=121162 RepID=UPI00406D7CE5
MAQIRLVKLIAICFGVCCMHITSGWQLPKDVEMLEGHEPPSTWIQDRGWASGDNHGRSSNGFVKAIRNRRALYRIKAIPYGSSDDEASDPDKFLQKRDTMDVSAQYTEQFAISKLDSRSKREVVDEDTLNNDKDDKDIIDITEAPEVQEWTPQSNIKEDQLNSLPNETPSTYNNAEPLLDRQSGREARGATKDQWIKLPYVGRPLENDQLSSSIPSNDEVNHRMPRVNFVTQNKGLQTAESRNQRESIPRSTYARSNLRTDIYPPNRDGRGRSLDYSTYSRQSFYYPDEYRRKGYYDDLDYYDDFYYNQRKDPYDRYDRYDKTDYRNGRRYDYNDYNRYKPYDRHDDYYGYDTARYDKPRRIIYYATLPDVIRTPPSVYRYPQTRYDDDKYYRDNRYDGYRSGHYYPRYPYSALKKSENEGPRDLSTSSTANKEKAADALKRQQESQKKNNDERARDGNLNSHQYPASLSTNMNVNDNKVPHQTLYHDVTRIDNDYHRYDHPSFQAAVDDPYVSRHD